MTQSQLPSALLRKARAWAGQLTKLARAYAPAHVRSSISSHVEEKNEASVVIRITANRQIAPDARAQEYGSGLHAKRGAKRKYLIKPKNKKLLAFYWDVATVSEMERGSPGKFMFAPDGRVAFRSVMHPGIQAANSGKGYIAPAVNEIRKRGRADLQKDIKQAILGDIRRSFGRR